MQGNDKKVPVIIVFLKIDILEDTKILCFSNSEFFELRPPALSNSFLAKSNS